MKLDFSSSCLNADCVLYVLQTDSKHLILLVVHTQVSNFWHVFYNPSCLLALWFLLIFSVVGLCGVALHQLLYLDLRVSVKRRHPAQALALAQRNVYTCCYSSILIVLKLISSDACDQMLNILTCFLGLCLLMVPTYSGGWEALSAKHSQIPPHLHPHIFLQVTRSNVLLVYLKQLLIHVVITPWRWIKNTPTFCFSLSDANTSPTVIFPAVSSVCMLTSFICFYYHNQRLY